MNVGDCAAEWQSGGSYFSWTPKDGEAGEVAVFHVECGEVSAPVLLLVHGFPTCSIDWFDVVPLLQDRYRVCALDFPGYGFSDKPTGWGYSLARDADLLTFYVSAVLQADSVVVLAHDRGTSVALNYALSPAGSGSGGGSSTTVEHLVLTNGNMFLPLSNLTDFQRLVLDPATAQSVLDVLTPERLAAGMGLTTFSPPRGSDHPDVAAMAATFAHGDGVQVLHETIQYLNERAEHERQWLDLLAKSDIRTSVIWGTSDTVSPPRVAMHLWDRFLMEKPGVNRFYIVPGANHYLQVDRPDAVVAAFLHADARQPDPSPGPIGADLDSPVLVDSSRDRLPSAKEVLARRA